MRHYKDRPQTEIHVGDIVLAKGIHSKIISPKMDDRFWIVEYNTRRTDVCYYENLKFITRP